jgi:hypothetical protein
MLGERDAQLDAKESTSGGKPIWRNVYSLMRCDSPTCQHGPYCWVDAMGKKHFPLKSHHIKRLISHVEKGGILESHKDVPGSTRRVYKHSKHLKSRDMHILCRMSLYFVVFCFQPCILSSGSWSISFKTRGLIQTPPLWSDNIGC